MEPTKKTKNAIKKLREYRAYRNFKLARHFPHDKKSVQDRNRLFKRHGNGWWARWRVPKENIPLHWCKSSEKI